MRQTALVVIALWFIAFAQNIQPPPVKEGLWLIHTTSIDNPGNAKSEFTSKLCRNHAYDQRVHAMAKRKPGCRTSKESVSGGVYHAEVECSVAGTTIHSTGTTTIEGDTAFRSESHATYTPPFHGVSETTMVVEQKYIGSCPAGIQPGDRIGQDGTVTHTGGH